MAASSKYRAFKMLEATKNRVRLAEARVESAHIAVKLAEEELEEARARLRELEGESKPTPEKAEAKGNEDTKPQGKKAK